MNTTSSPGKFSATRHRAPWTHSEIKRANELVAQGLPRKEVASILGRTVFGVRCHLPRKKRPVRPDRNTLQGMITDDMTYSEIAQVFKVNVSTVKSWTKRYRLRIRRRGRLPDPQIRANILNLIETGHTSRGALCKELGRDASLVWQWLTELLDDGLITRTGRGRGTRYQVAWRWLWSRAEKD